MLVALAVSKQGDTGFLEPKSRIMCHLFPRYEVEALQCCILLVSVEKGPVHTLASLLSELLAKLNLKVHTVKTWYKLWVSGSYLSIGIMLARQVSQGF